MTQQSVFVECAATSVSVYTAICSIAAGAIPRCARPEGRKENHLSTRQNSVKAVFVAKTDHAHHYM